MRTRSLTFNGSDGPNFPYAEEYTQGSTTWRAAPGAQGDGSNPPDDGFNADADYEGETYESIDPRDQIPPPDSPNAPYVEVAWDTPGAYEHYEPGVIREISGPPEGNSTGGLYVASNAYMGIYQHVKESESSSWNFQFGNAKSRLEAVPYGQSGHDPNQGWQGDGRHGVKTHASGSSWHEKSEEVLFYFPDANSVTTSDTFMVSESSASISSAEVRLECNEVIDPENPDSQGPVSRTFILLKETHDLNENGEATGEPEYESLANIVLTIEVGKISTKGEVVSGELPSEVTVDDGIIRMGPPSAEKGKAITFSLFPIEFEIIHTEKQRDDDGNELATTVNPGRDTLLRDEIADLKVKLPTINSADWDLKLDLEPASMKTEILGARGDVQMYDVGKIEDGAVTPLTINADGTTKAAPYDIKLTHAKGGQETFKIVVNKEGKFKLRVKTTDNKVDLVSQEFTVTKRIRKYGKDTATATFDFNKHDKHFEKAAQHWGTFYQHQVDDVERLKAIGMTESELGRNPQNSTARPNDIMTIGHPNDHVLDALHFVSGYQEKEVDPQNNAIRDLNYPAAAATPAGTAIHWGTCWLYHKAQTIASNPMPPPSYIPGPWRTWDNATTRYNGGGVNNYLDRVTRAFKQGRHPTDNTTIWPLLTNGRARQ